MSAFKLTGVLILVTCLRLSLAAGATSEVIIANFDRPGDEALWSAGDSGGVKLTVEARDKTDRNKSLRVETINGEYPGISTDKLPADWSQYEVFSFVVWAPSGRELGIRIDDANSKNYATRYNGGVTIEKGRNLVQIPVKSLAKVLTTSKIKMVVLFTAGSPKGYTLYYDDFRLGSMQTDKVDFIPYDQRIDLVPSTKVESPHLPLAKPTAGGAIKTLCVYGMEEGRDLSELMQRIDLQVSPVSWGRESGIHKWIGLNYGERTYELSQRYLASSAQGPEKFDTMILGMPTGWIHFGKAATEAIVDRVKNRGEGLVLVFPFPGGKASQAWPDDLKSISALVDSETDYLPAGDKTYIKVASSGHVNGQKWKIVKDHPITHGLPIEALPFEALNVQAYKLAPGAQTLIETEDGHPVVAVREVGNARVVTFAVRSESIAPAIGEARNGRQWRDYRYWEVFYDLLARSAMWTAKRDMSRNGEAVVLKDAKYPDSALTLSQWKNAKGEVTAWEMGFNAPQYAAITVQSPQFIKKGDELQVQFKLTGEPAADTSYTLRFVDYAGNRRRTMLERPLNLSDIKDAAANSYKLVVPTAKLDQLAIFVEVEATKGGKRAAFGQSVTYVTPSAAWDDYEIYGWSAGGVSYLRDLQMQKLQEFGLTTEQVHGNEAYKSFQRGFRVQTMMSGTGMHAEGFDEHYREFARTGDKKLLVRSPSFADPAFLAKQKADKQAWLKNLIPFSPLTVSLGDETSLTSYTAAFDFDFHPDNIANFRTKLKAKFGTIQNLNAALGEKWESFDAIEPPVTADAKKAGKFGLWNEWREHNDDMWAGAFQFYADFLKEVYPQTRLSVSGTQTSGVFNGIDWAKLSLPMGAVADYTGRYQLAQRLSFNPNIRSTPWAGYGRSGRGADYQIWTNLSFEGDGSAFFWYPSLLNPDFTFSESAESYMRSLSVLRAGVGKQYLQTRRQWSPVAILWSPRSQREAWLQDKEAEFIATEKAVYETLVDAGYDPSFISDAQVAAGELKTKGIRALALPMSLALGRGGKAGGLDELSAIKAFLADGGAVVNTHPVAFDEFLQPANLPADVSGKFLAFVKDADGLQKLLESSKVMPYANIRDTDGKRVSNVNASLHRLYDSKGATAGAILTILRAPVGQKEVVGADGVVYMQADPAGGPPIQKLSIEIPLAKDMEVFDIRSRQALPVANGKITIDMQDGDGRPIAILPYGKVTIAAKISRTADALSVNVALSAPKAGAALLPHVVRMDVKDLDSNQTDGLLSRNLLADATGNIALELPLAKEDASRKLEITLTDILTGAQATAKP